MLDCCRRPRLHPSHHHHRSIPSSSPTRENHSHLQYSGVYSVHTTMPCLWCTIFIAMFLYASTQSYACQQLCKQLFALRYCINSSFSCRKSDNQPIFDTRSAGYCKSLIVKHMYPAAFDVPCFSCCVPAVNFADQFLSIATTLPGDYNIYGLGEHKTPLRLK